MKQNIAVSELREFHALGLLRDKRFLLAICILAGLLLWFMPTPSGLSTVGKHALAAVIFTVLLWVTGATLTSVGSLLLIGIVLCFIPQVKPQLFMAFWAHDTIWFVLVGFIFSAALELSGLGKRLTLYVFSIRRLIYIDIALLALNTLFSAVGMNASFPKLALLFPLITTMAALSGMQKNDSYVRHLALMINILANTTGVFLYSGFTMNPALGSLGGFKLNYATWLQWFFVPASIYGVITFIVIYFMFRPKKESQGFNQQIVKEQRKSLGPLTITEIKTIFWLALAVGLWATGGLTGLSTGFVAILVSAMMMLPGVGVITFKQYADKTNWNAVFMMMGVLAIGSLGSTGFADWLWAHILPSHMPHNPMLSITFISFLVEILHIPLGSVATSQALAIPSLAGYATTLGVSRILTSFVAYLSIVGQFFFPYQNAALIVGLGYGLWEPKNILKFGAVMFVLTPLILGVLLYPWWLLMGWIG